MKILHLLILVALTSCVTAQVPPIQRNPFTTNYPPVAPVIFNPSISNTVRVSKGSAPNAVVAFDGYWNLFGNNSGIFGLENVDNGAVPFYVTNANQLVFPPGFRVVTGAGAGQILTSDANGSAAWSNPPATVALSTITNIATNAAATAVTNFASKNLLGVGDAGNTAVEFFDDYAIGATAMSGGWGWGSPGILKGTSSVVLRTNQTTGMLENRLEMKNSSYGRRMPWGNKWKRLRVAVLLNATGTSDFTNVFVLGVCYGTNAMYANNSTTTNFVGQFWGGTANVTNPAPATFQYSNFPPAHDLTYFVISQSGQMGQITNGNWIPRSISGTLERAVGATHSTLFGFEMVRNTWSETNAIVWTGRAPSHNDLIPGTVERVPAIGVTIMEMHSGPTGTAWASGTANSGNPTVTTPNWPDTLFGPLDTINLYWANPTVAGEIRAVIVMRIY